MKLKQFLAELEHTLLRNDADEGRYVDNKLRIFPDGKCSGSMCPITYIHYRRTGVHVDTGAALTLGTGSLDLDRQVARLIIAASDTTHSPYHGLARWRLNWRYRTLRRRLIHILIPPVVK